jgi:ubiquinone/menaquinone biosynthesis C-methylase UbiE
MVNESLDEQKLREYYDSIAEERFNWVKKDRASHIRHLRVSSEARKLIEELASKKPNEKIVVLDVGAGFGEILAYLRSTNTYRVACDISQRALEIAKRNVDDAVVCNAEALPFHDKSIDLILCVEVIEHVINPANLLKEIKRVLRPRGKFILTTPNADNKYYKHDKEHLHSFNRETLIKLISEAGLKVTFLSSIKIRHWKWLVPLLSYEESILIEGEKEERKP